MTERPATITNAELLKFILSSPLFDRKRGALAPVDFEALFY
jgi:hypothetical protein